MLLFKKRKKFDTTSLEKKEKKIESKLSNGTPKKTKKIVKIGFGQPETTEPVEASTSKKENIKTVNDEQTQISKETAQFTDEEVAEKQYKNVDVFQEEILLNSEENIGESDISDKKEKERSKSKRKVLMQKDMKGKPVFLEDTGEKIGTIFDVIYDVEKNLKWYKIKDNKSETILSFPIDQFDKDKSGLIFIPSWYTKGIKTIEKLEFKDRISPELAWLLTDSTISDKELYNIFVKHDDEISSYIDEAMALRELLNNRLKILERERLTLKDGLMDLTEKRLIKDIDRRKFSEIVMEHRRKVNVLDVNIKKCKELIKRLEQTSFGILSKNMHSNVKQKDLEYNKELKSSQIEDKKLYEQEIENPYKDKYHELKNRYDSLQEEHNELKTAVEKLLNKNEI